MRKLRRRKSPRDLPLLRLTNSKPRRSTTRKTKPATITEISANIELDPVAQSYADRINASTDYPLLHMIGQEIAANKELSTKDRAHLRGIFGTKRIELMK
jgi:hypothetical protein